MQIQLPPEQTKQRPTDDAYPDSRWASFNSTWANLNNQQFARILIFMKQERTKE